MTENKTVLSIPLLDLERYLGLWYEIGRLPLKWEDTHATNVTAHYSLEDDGAIRVDNRCFDNEDKPTQALGRALPVDGETSQLKVSFLPKYLRWIPFTEGDYWVLKIDADYTVALVGSPDHQNLWLLAREPQVDQATQEQYLAVAREQGFDLTQWITPTHDGRYVEDSLLED